MALFWQARSAKTTISRTFLLDNKYGTNLGTFLRKDKEHVNILLTLYIGIKDI